MNEESKVPGAQSEKCLTLDLVVVSPSPMLGVQIT